MKEELVLGVLDKVSESPKSILLVNELLKMW
jgi:hypothetical protein